MSEKEYHICPHCGKKWMCREGKECRHFSDGNCDCESCCSSVDCDSCEEVPINMETEKVIFT